MVVVEERYSAPKATMRNTGAAAGLCGNIQQLEVLRIVASGLNPRKHFDEQALQELADSIAEHGLLEPIVVREITLGSMCYEIIAGERRWRASAMAGLTTIPAVVLENIDDRKALELALVENLVRRDIDPIEEAEGYAKLREMGHKVLDIASKVNRSQEAVSNAIRLLKLPDEIQEHVRSGKLSMSHGKALASFVGHPKMLEYKAKRALMGATTKEIERVCCEHEAVQRGAIAQVYTSEIGVDTAKECLKCDHRRGSQSNGWLCLDVDCLKQKKAARRIEKLNEAKAAHSIAPDADIPQISSLVSFKCLYPLSIPAGCSENCEHRSIALSDDNVQEVCLNPSCFDDLRIKEGKCATCQTESAKQEKDTERQKLLDITLDRLKDAGNMSKITAIAVMPILVESSINIIKESAAHLGLDIDCDALQDSYGNEDAEIESYKLLSQIPAATLILLAGEVILREEMRYGEPVVND